MRTTDFASVVPVTAITPVASAQELEAVFLVEVEAPAVIVVTPAQAPALMLPKFAMFSPTVAFMPEPITANSETRALTV
ncbi:hypothetical protein D3C78_1825160 [compost metagenome]